MKSAGLLIRSSIIAALGGFLFGFDTVVISGAEQAIQSLWDLSDTMHGLAVGIAIWGTVIGSLCGAWPTDKFGRKKTLILIGAFYLISSVWSALAQDVNSFMLARFLGGLGVGISTITAPLYISEIAPAKLRGRLAGMFQFNIVFGILIAFFSNAVIRNLAGDDAWRWMLGVAAIPSLIYMFASFFVPESPRWLIAEKNDRATGEQVLARINPELSSREVEDHVNKIAAAASEEVTHGGFWTKEMRTPIALAFLIAFFNQLSGINAILYFAPRIFELTGLGQQAALLQSVGIGITNLIFTFVGLWLIDRVGRRTLLYIGSIGYIASLGLCSWAFFSESYAIVPYCIFAFIAAHAIGQGAVIWVFIAEIFPNHYRAMGQSLGSFTHWIFAALLTTFFPQMISKFPPGYVFLFFCGMMVLQLIWVKLMVPETKGVSLEEIQHRLGV
jgi:sugar porter (SP) family MFS transporter